MFSYKSDLTFLMISYSIGHGVLAFKSKKTEQRESLVEILFKDVRAMEMRCWFHGIHIEEVDLSFFDGRPSKPHEMLEMGNRVYAVHGDGWEGFIVGGTAWVHDDEAPRSAVA